MSDDRRKRVVVDIGEGIGCLLVAVSLAVMIWALQGFPGLAR